MGGFFVVKWGVEKEESIVTFLRFDPSTGSGGESSGSDVLHIGQSP
jgi:hypothetical protein